MKKEFLSAMTLGVLVLATAAGAALSSGDFTKGTPEIQSMSALAFGPEGVLFVGDGKAGAIFAIDLGDQSPATDSEGISIPNIEAKIASLLGTTPDAIMIHDMAVNPISTNVYLSVSRGRGKWDSRWLLPNDIADANINIVDKQLCTGVEFRQPRLDDIRKNEEMFLRLVTRAATQRAKNP